MKWITKYPINPKIGDRISFKSFALFPIKTDNGYTVWLEYFWKGSEYEEVRILELGHRTPHTETGWRTISKTAIV